MRATGIKNLQKSCLIKVCACFFLLVWLIVQNVCTIEKKQFHYGCRSPKTESVGFVLSVNGKGGITTIPSEVSDLYMTILEDTFKSNEGDRKKQIQGLKERIKDQEEKTARCDDMLLNREIDRDSHQRMISKLKEEIVILHKKIRTTRKQ